MSNICFKSNINIHLIELINTHFEAIVPIAQSLVRLVKQAGGLQEGALSFMANFYLFEFTVHVHLSHGERGLQALHQTDVSKRPGCIQRVLRSTTRYALEVIHA